MAATAEKRPERRGGGPLVCAKAGKIRHGERVVLFNEAEHFVFSRWFQEQKTRRSCTTGDEIDRALDSLGIPDLPFDDIHGRANAAVARILLEADEKQLPNWYYTDEDGTVATTRKHRSAKEKPQRKVALRSQHLLTIDWGDGPVSWPVSYRVVWVPGFERYVLTASNDGGIDGCAADAALAALPPGGSELLERVGERLRNHWFSAASYDQEAWASCFATGLVPEATAPAWRDEVWSEDAGE